MKYLIVILLSVFTFQVAGYSAVPVSNNATSTQILSPKEVKQQRKTAKRLAKAQKKLEKRLAKAKKKKRNWGKLSLIFGILSFPLILVFPLSIICTILAIVFGFKGLKHEEQRKNAKWGLTLGFLMIFIILIGMLGEGCIICG